MCYYTPFGTKRTMLLRYSTNQEFLGLKLRIPEVCLSFVSVTAGFQPSLLSRLTISLICFTWFKKHFALFD